MEGLWKKRAFSKLKFDMSAAAYQNEPYDERQCFKWIRILVATKGEKDKH